MEFRPMDNPILNKEKTALCFFLVLMQRIFLDKKLGVNFYIPMSKSQENLKNSHKGDAVRKQKFVARKYFS